MLMHEVNDEQSLKSKKKLKSLFEEQMSPEHRTGFCQKVPLRTFYNSNYVTLQVSLSSNGHLQIYLYFLSKTYISTYIMLYILSSSI